MLGGRRTFGERQTVKRCNVSSFICCLKVIFTLTHKMGRREALMLLAALCLLSSSAAAAVISPNSFVRSQDLVVALRGGGTDKKTKRKQKTKSKANKKDISDAMKEKDAAEALGDAIR